MIDLTRPGRRAAALLVALLPALQACVTPVTVSPSAAASADGDVRLTLTPEGAASLVSSLGPRAESIDGRIVEHTDSALSVVVSRVARTTGTQEDWPADRITVPVSAVRSVAVRRVSVGRSVVLGGAIAVGMILIGRSLRGSAEGSVNGGGEPTTGK